VSWDFRYTSARIDWALAESSFLSPDINNYFVANLSAYPNANLHVSGAYKIVWQHDIQVA